MSFVFIRGRVPVAEEEHPFGIGFLVHDVSRLRRTVIDKALRPIRITRSQWWVLASLSHHDGQGMMQTELARTMDVGKVTLGGLLDRLEAAGLVRRRPDAQDRRAKRVVMTARGVKLLSRVRKIARDANRRIMSGIAKHDIARAESVLHRMKRRLISMDAIAHVSSFAEPETHD